MLWILVRGCHPSYTTITTFKLFDIYALGTKSLALGGIGPSVDRDTKDVSILTLSDIIPRFANCSTVLDFVEVKNLTLTSSSFSLVSGAPSTEQIHQCNNNIAMDSGWLGLVFLLIQRLQHLARNLQDPLFGGRLCIHSIILGVSVRLAKISRKSCSSKIVDFLTKVLYSSGPTRWLLPSTYKIAPPQNSNFPT